MILLIYETWFIFKKVDIQKIDNELIESTMHNIVQKYNFIESRSLLDQINLIKELLYPTQPFTNSIDYLKSHQIKNDLLNLYRSNVMINNFFIKLIKK